MVRELWVRLTEKFQFGEQDADTESGIKGCMRPGKAAICSDVGSHPLFFPFTPPINSFVNRGVISFAVFEFNTGYIHEKQYLTTM